MHRLLPFFLPMIFTHQGFCRTQLRLQCAWQSNVLGSGWKHCYKHKHMETKARWVVKCLTASTTPTPSRLCELEMALLTRMLQNDSDFSREQTRTDVSFCGFLGILIQLRVGFSKNPGLEKLHYDKQICRSLAVDHGVWCLKVLGEGWRAWGTISGAIEWICCKYLYIYRRIEKERDGDIVHFYTASGFLLFRHVRRVRALVASSALNYLTGASRLDLCTVLSREKYLYISIYYTYRNRVRIFCSPQLWFV